MSSTDKKNENQDSANYQNKSTDAVRQKLNTAISSYFFDTSADNPNPADKSDPESLLEIVKEGVSVDIHPIIDENAIEENIPETEESVNDVGEGGLEVPIGPDSNNNAALNAKLFSGAFEEIEYQSVDVEIKEKGPESDFDEQSSRYAQIVQDALNSSPKESTPTVLESGYVPLTRASSGKLKASGINACKFSSFETKEKETFSFEKKNNFPTDFGKGNVVSSCSSSEESVSKRDEVIKEQALEGKMEKAEKSTLSDVSATKKRVLFSGMKEKETITVEETRQEAFKDNVPKKASAGTPRPEIVLLYNETHIDHNPSAISIEAHEKPERLIKAMWYLEKSDVFRTGQCTLMDAFDMASEEDLLRVHEKDYIDFVKSYSSAGGGFLGDSTYMTSRTFEVAKLSAGAAIKAGSLVADGKYPYAFVMTRPPGHHASENRYGGYCLFNNVAILARYLQKKKHAGKIMIIDWDAHAGDGTMDIFYEDPTVMFVSLHRDPHGFYPRKGFSKEIGEGAGRDYTVNVEMPVGAGDDEYALVFEEVVMPVLKSFSPEFVICSCGFDAYYKEKNIGLSLTSEGFHRMTSMIKSVYPENFILIMEGGYHDSNGQLCHSVLSALLDEANPVNDRPEISSFKKNQQQQVLNETRAKIAEVKKFVPMLG